MDRLQELSVMQAAALEGSFVLAAQRLGISQASVTRAIASLERRLGIPLFDRSNAQVRMSDAGVAFLAHARRVTEALDQAGAAALAGLPQARGVVKVAAPMGLAAIALAPVLTAFATAHPGVTVRCSFHESPREAPDPGADVVLAITGDRPSSASGAVIGKVWRTTAAATRYLGKHGAPKSLKDLAAHRLIDIRGKGTGSNWSDMETARFIPAPRVWTDSDEATLHACAAGMGLARVWSYELMRSELQEILPRYREAARTVMLHTRQSASWHPAKLFSELAIEILRKQSHLTVVAASRR
jgi:DNA-binding transcriptional LysR family regulator